MRTACMAASAAFLSLFVFLITAACFLGSGDLFEEVVLWTAVACEFFAVCFLAVWASCPDEAGDQKSSARCDGGADVANPYCSPCEF